ncbi:MAG: glycoside hydrolase family 3 C-terminal domain-containing protein, partial [Clostridia bacterium]|nr:glycoside hydrolase family 3 C-terminal domain-containing protein [Clostridia bacterium]
GKALGGKCLEEKVGVLLGPGVNMKRSPLCGRNFEYFSEDPVLAGELAASFINGVQSRGVGTSLKHFCANDQETRRMNGDSVVDERALREVYLPAFEIAVKKSQPWTVMNSYNKINGTFGSENAHTQTEILRDDWGFEGAIVTDWGACNERDDGLAAGCDIEMPCSSGGGMRKILAAIESGKISEDVLNERVLKILELIKKASDGAEKAAKEGFEFDEEKDHVLAKEIAEQSMVLLKNDGILPLDKSKKVAVIGEMAKTPRYQGAGSSQINPTHLDSAYDILVEAGVDATYSQGYERTLAKAKKNPAHIAQAVEAAKAADTVLLFIGLTEDYESEGFDRSHMKLPDAHIELVKAVSAVNSNIVVILSGGAPVEFDWDNDSVRAILNSYLGGQAGAGAVVDIVLGNVNPCGKLAETYPEKLEDNPSYNNFPGNLATVEYRESIYIGYRYYEKAQQPVRYPFGYGLSYTTFEYSGLYIDKTEMDENDTLSVSFRVKNTGSVAGSEITQLYVGDRESTIFRPVKELKGFKKVYLEPGEEQAITITLNRRAFAFFNVNTNDWCVESGDFDIYVGASSADIRLTGTVKVNAAAADIPDYSTTAPIYYTGKVQSVPDDQFTAVLGRPIPPTERDRSTPLTVVDSFETAAYTKWGGRINNLMHKMIPVFVKGPGADFAIGIATQTPIRDFMSMSGGVFSEKMAAGLLRILNGDKPGKGLRMILSDI